MNVTGDTTDHPAAPGDPGAPDAREHWNRRYRDQAPSEEPVWILPRIHPMLPRTGTALDIAGGGGRNALWLADRGLAVTLVDISDEALGLAAVRARNRGVALVTRRIDVERDRLPAGPWDVVLIVHYLQRDLLARIPALLVPGGLVVLVVATRRNLERHARPPTRYLLDEGEAPGLLPGLDILHYEEGWSPEDRHEAAVVARLPMTGA